MRIGSYIQDHLGGIMGNFLFGCMLGTAAESGICRNRLFECFAVHCRAMPSFNLFRARCSRVSTAPCFRPIMFAISSVL